MKSPKYLSKRSLLLYAIQEINQNIQFQQYLIQEYPLGKHDFEHRTIDRLQEEKEYLREMIDCLERNDETKCLQLFQALKNQ